MAEFRRLISYIYEYEGNVKGKNVGFVKLEARNGMCRLNVNVKKLYMGSGDMGVYLLTGRQEIFLGNIFLRSGCGEFRAVVQVADVQDSGETMDECYGLTIHSRGENWRVYTTIWEDAIAQTAQLMLEPVTSENAFEHEVESGKLSPVVPKLDEVQEIQGTEAVQRADLPKKPEYIQKADLPQNPGDVLEAENMQRAEAKRGMDRESKKEWMQGQDNLHKAGLQKERSIQLPFHPLQPEGNAGNSQVEPDWKNDTALPNFEMGMLELETEHPDIPLKKSKPKAPEPQISEQTASASNTAEPEIPELKSSELQKEAPQPVIHQYREEPLIIGDPEALAKLDAEDAEEKQVPIWDFLSKTYPKIQAFDSEHGCQVLVIKPQDIGLLPREIWIYGNNSFLLHGYYNYRYLILARLENPKGMPRYLLGVPGHYYSNEKYMASMFGFPHFVLSKKQTTQNGRFGYWYTDIRLEDGALAEHVNPSETDKTLQAASAASSMPEVRTMSAAPAKATIPGKVSAETAASAASTADLWKNRLL
ncbi:MAG: DUF6128 domain-containing protein [Lachnospiraceae bacterium]|nr:DUF6128 domain-containing protein [Lachnospiraceae bacterium]